MTTLASQKQQIVLSGTGDSCRIRKRVYPVHALFCMTATPPRGDELASRASYK